MRRLIVLTIVLVAVMACPVIAEQWSLLFWTGPGIWIEDEVLVKLRGATA